jgi:uncharacterized zinc-type alcohol dehydrogenase-like protein
VGGAVTRLQPGARVGVGYIKDSCGECLACLRGCENVCAKGPVGTIERGGQGGWADFVRVKAKFAIPIPEALDSAHAAPLLCAGVTVYSPLRQYLAPGADVAVLGAGGLGHLAVQFADKMGACVTAVDVQAHKAAECCGEMGAVASLSAEQFFAGADKFDLVLNCATSEVDGAKLAATLRPGGVAVQLGIPGAGLTCALPVLETAFLELKFVGSNTGGRAITAEMLQFAAKKRIAPRVETMAMKDVNKAIERINAGEAHYRIVLVNQ